MSIKYRYLISWSTLNIDVLRMFKSYQWSIYFKIYIIEFNDQEVTLVRQIIKKRVMNTIDWGWSEWSNWLQTAHKWNL